jgi:gliding motility-associated-like protein
MRVRLCLSIILIICFVLNPRTRIVAQRPEMPIQHGPAATGVPGRSTFGIIRSGEDPSVMEKWMKIRLEHEVITRNPEGGTVSTRRVVLGGITLVVQSNGTTCGSSNGSFFVTASGGTAPYQYSENGYPYQSSGLFTQKAAGTYTITVQDANGLTATTTVVLTNTYAQPNVPQIVTYTNATGCMGADASVTVSGSGGTPPYQYSMDEVNWQTGNVFSNLIPGDYSFFVRDANGCVNVKPFPLSRNCQFNFAYTYSSLVCKPGDGYIQFFFVGGGVAPYSYSQDGVNWQSSGMFTGYGVGRHVIYIKDAAGNEMSWSFPMYPYCPIDVSAVAAGATCGNSDGTITATGSDGQPPYGFSLDGVNFQANNVFTGLAPGNYTVTIRDNNDLRTSTDVTVPSGCPSVTVTSVNDVCAKGVGSVQATGSGGSPPYLFSIDGVNFQTSGLFSGLTAGNYTLTIKDNNNAIATASFTLVNSCPIVTATEVDATCGRANGRIDGTGSQGQAPYQYSLDGTHYQTASSFSSLSSGVFTLYVQDAAGGTATTSVTIHDLAGPVLQVNPSPASCADNDGTLTIAATGGTAPLLYSIDGVNYQSSSLFSLLKSGSYLAEAKDANGCPASAQSTITVNNTVTVEAGNNVTICQGWAAQLNGQTNGTRYSWSPAADLSNPQSINPKAFPGQTTTYYLTASTGVCQGVDSVVVFVNPAPVANAGADTAICVGKSVQLHGSGGVGYSWMPTQYLDNPDIADPTVSAPPATLVYSLLVSDGNGCQSLNNATVKVTVTPTAVVFAGQDTSIAMGEPLQLHAIDVNNSNFSAYTWSPAFGLDDPNSQNPLAVLDQSMTYTVTATAPGGCTGEDQIHISVYKGPDIYVPNAFSPNGDGHNDALRAIPIGIKEFHYFRIFSRWGQVVFQTTNPSNGWNGLYNGQLQSSGTFVWMAEGNDYQGRLVQRKGTVILVR